MIRPPLKSELRVGMDIYPRGAEITKFGTFTDLKQITCLMLHDDRILYLTYMYYVFKHWWDTGTLYVFEHRLDLFYAFKHLWLPKVVVLSFSNSIYNFTSLFFHLIIYHRVQVEIRHYNIGIPTLIRLTLQLYLHIPGGVPNTYKLLIQYQL